MKKYISTIAFLLIVASFSFGQDTTIGITRAELSCRKVFPGGKLKPYQIELVFDKSFQSILQILNTDSCFINPANARCETFRNAQLWIGEVLRHSSNYEIMQIGGEHKVPLTVVSTGLDPYPYDPSQDETALENSITLTLDDIPDSYLPSEHILIAKNASLSKFTAGKRSPLMIPVIPNSGCEVPETEMPDLAKPTPVPMNKDIKTIHDHFSAPALKDSPALKVDLAAQGAKGGKSVYSFNLGFRPYTTRRLGFGGYYDLAYFFVDTEVKINAKTKDKKNVLNIGAFQMNHTKVFRDDGDRYGDQGTTDRYATRFLSMFVGLNTTVTPKIETEWGFDELSYILNLKESLPINIYQSRLTGIHIDPFIGIDIGYKDRTKASKRGWNVARPFAGLGFTVNLLRKEDKPRIAWQTDYIRRFFLKEEASYGYDIFGNEIPDRLSKRPRDHVKSTITYNTGLFSPFVEYEYGRLPPKFTLINSSFKTGIKFDADVVWKAFRK